MPASRSPRFLGWRMVALGFLAQNLALGLTFGSFGVLIKPVAAELDISRGTASLGIAVILLLMGCSGPLLGVALARYSTRRVMSLGALLMAGGFALASQSREFPMFLLGYSIVAGAGCAALGVIPSTTLVSNWFVARVGFAIGLVSVPLLVGLAPPVVAWIVDSHGWRKALLAQAALLLALLPLLQLIVSRPEEVGQRALGSVDAPGNAQEAPAPEPRAGMRELTRSPWFWGVLLGTGLLTSGGIVIVSHLVPFATDRGIPNTQAALLQSLQGVFSMAGALLFGYVADRLGPRATLGMIGIFQAALWSLLLMAGDLTTMIPLMIGIGLCGGGAHPAFSTLLNRAYGRASFATALGLATLLMLPFTFVAAPLAGWIFDQSGSYSVAFQVEIGAFAIAALSFLVLCRGRG